MNVFTLLVGINGIIYLLIGVISKWFPPKKINRFYGYRTKASMKNQANWQFAQNYSTKLLLKCGLLLLLLSLLGYLIDFERKVQLMLALALVIVVAILPILLTQKALKKFENKA